MFRDRRQDRREERRGGTGAMHYRMRQKLVSIGDDYWIENDQLWCPVHLDLVWAS